uniref:Uncharacterized protein n=1 Tax=Leersia perrieri TaxID=77586 RepID=A0A0D9UX56_9ORYZ
MDKGAGSINSCYKQANYSIGQFNAIDSGFSHESTSRVACKIISVFGLRKQWRSLWHVKARN